MGLGVRSFYELSLEPEPDPESPPCRNLVHRVLLSNASRFPVRAETWAHPTYKGVDTIPHACFIPESLAWPIDATPAHDDDAGRALRRARMQSDATEASNISCWS